MNVTIGQHARQTYDQVESHGAPSNPMPFGTAAIRRGTVVDALVVYPVQGTREVQEGIVRRADIAHDDDSARAYLPIRQLQRSLFGAVFACLELKPHRGQEAQQQAAQIRATQQEVARTQGLDVVVLDSIVWESTEVIVAIKRQERALFDPRVMVNRRPSGDDPIMEVAVMQFLGDQHSNILGSIEAFEDDTYLYSVTPLCRGGDLFELVFRDGRMTEPVARFWFKQILAGLHQLQTQGICHRDLSPENILVHGNNLKIFDFGMALWEPYNSTMAPGTVTNVLGGVDRRLIKRRPAAGKKKYMVSGTTSCRITFVAFVRKVCSDCPGAFPLLLCCTVPRDF